MFNGLLGSNKNSNQNRYIRLIVLSACQIITSLPFSLFILIVNAHFSTVYPWVSWNNTHFDYSFVGQYPSFMWRSIPISAVITELNRWVAVYAAFLFFAFFGFAEEARRHYSKAYSFATSSLRLPNFLKSSASSSSSPVFTPSSSFGQSFKRGMATFSFTSGSSALGSRSKFEIITTERKDSLMVSEYRLTSSASIFESIDNSSKVLEILPGDDDSQLAPAPVSQSAVEALAAVSKPLPPPPVARVSTGIRPPGLYPSFPHSPTKSDLDPSDAV